MAAACFADGGYAYAAIAKQTSRAIGIPAARISFFELALSFGDLKRVISALGRNYSGPFRGLAYVAARTIGIGFALFIGRWL